VLVFLVLVVIYPLGYAVWMSFQRIVLSAAVIVLFCR